MIEVAALYVQEDGVYCGLPFVDMWPESRDARKYSGPYPVIAHPPCQRWGALASVNYKRWGGEHNRPGNDGGCFCAALSAVRRWGGVLEHPAKSKAFEKFGIATPRGIGWNQIGEYEYVCEVWQSAYGHMARKATWLYFVGFQPRDMIWDRKPGTHQVGGCDRRGKSANKSTLSKREANATPPAFRDALLELARHARVDMTPKI